ncbi:MAG: hypothetical protein EAZ15_04990 [Sphingobacteriales bacterium]|nr:MAG: hypothetical protein EAZ15_04990 [Sphingobacteriales bacterium]
MKIKFANCWLFFWILAFSFSANSQPFNDLRFKHINSEMGLGDTQITTIYRDSQGLLWVGTESGLWYYNGLEMINVPSGSQNGKLDGKYITQIVEDKNADLFIGTQEGLNRLVRKTFTIQKLRVLKDENHPGYNKNYIQPFYIDEDRQLWIYTGFNHSTLYKLNLNTKTIQPFLDNVNGVRAVFPNVFHKKLQSFWYVEQTGAYLVNQTNGKANNRKTFFCDKPKFEVNEVIIVGNNTWLATKQGLVLLNKNNGAYKMFFPSTNHKEITSFGIGENKKLYCGTVNGGLYIFDIKLQRFVKNIKHIENDLLSLPLGVINKIYIDDKQFLYIGVANEGVSIANLNNQKLNVFIPNLNLPQLGNLQYQCFLLHNNFMYVGTNLAGLLVLNKQGVIVKKILLPNGKIPNVKKIIFAKKLIFVATTTGLYYLNNNKLIATKNDNKAFTYECNDLNLLPNGRFFCATTKGLFEIVKKTIGFNLVSIDSTNNLEWIVYKKIIALKGNQIVLHAMYSYFFKIDFSTQVQKLGKFFPFEAEVNNYSYLNRGNLLVCGSNGLNIFNIATQKFKSITFFNGTTCFATLPLKNKKKLVLTEKGAYKICFSDLKPNKIVEENWFGLKKFTDAKPVFWLNKWWIGAVGGLYVYDDNIITKDIFFLKINAITINNKKSFSKPINNRITLPPLCKQFSIDFSLLNYDLSKQYYLRYKINNLDSFTSVKQNFTVLRYNGFAPGNYQLVVQVLNQQNKVIKQQIYCITQQAAWFEQLWAKLIFVFFVLILVFWASFIRIGFIKKKIQQKVSNEKKLQQAQNQTFRAQMNPHFIFNTLNSINTFIINNEKDKASDYLLQFSKLVRFTLENSISELVVLSKDIEALKLYLQLECVRLNYKFTFNINLEQAIDANDFYIPPMLIQPFVENAIWHGIAPSLKKGYINIDIGIQSIDSWFITITDNGIGYNISKNSKEDNSNKQSLGIEITRQRILVLNKKNSVIIKEILNTSNEVIGTQVTIIMYYSY